MTILRDIAYRSGDAHQRHRGDYFPGPLQTSPLWLLIHGGGWDAMSKEALDPVALFLQERGAAVFGINYRLLQHAPWPAALEDCLTAADFLQRGEICPAPSRIGIAGASAGGHLALMAGRAIGRSRVAHILSLAGPVAVDAKRGTSHAFLFSPSFHQRFFGAESITPAHLDSASALRHENIPPDLTCVHSVNDRLVPLTHSRDAVAAWQRAGARAALHVFDGPDDDHGFWAGGQDDTRRMSQTFSQALAEACSALNFPK
ncbi:alpha/beta hydrolase fold [Terrimicrobium sacchariphilum]|uniref:Alpha/beta hydrolase fold n=1 Tax=Terrimicrobium sacchariphilum TaxID=690879 RepID=A0A146G367_TERSA|nr:alpha/beta hydrolase fold domain-containing protein [Terrimicrobium sacchariphilum]GAT32279.1 alpha/beta hydrolase fold [Terrimicrobium sacchariphilum]